MHGGDGVQQWDDNTSTAVDDTAASAAPRPPYDADGINYNPALDFDGVDDYIEIIASNGISPTEEISIDIWMKGKNLTEYQYLVSGYDDCVEEVGYYLYVENQSIRFVIFNSTGSYEVNTSTNLNNRKQ